MFQRICSYAFERLDAGAAEEEDLQEDEDGGASQRRALSTDYRPPPKMLALARNLKAAGLICIVALDFFARSLPALAMQLFRTVHTLDIGVDTTAVKKGCWTLNYAMDTPQTHAPQNLHQIKCNVGRFSCRVTDSVHCKWDDLVVF